MDNFSTNKWFRNQYIKNINESDENEKEKEFSSYFKEVDPKFIYSIFDYITKHGLPSTASQFYWDLNKHFNKDV